MGLIEWAGSLGSNALGYILPFLFVLTIVVFFHELGHFLVARWTGVAVKTFSVGFGPELFGFNDRKGTRWRLSLIPLGGYVRFLGDENEASVPSQAALEQMSPADRAPLVRRQGRRGARRHRRRRADRQFHSGHRDFHRDFQYLRPRGDDAGGRRRGARVSGGDGRFPGGRRRSIDRRQQDRELLGSAAPGQHQRQPEPRRGRPPRRPGRDADRQARAEGGHRPVRQQAGYRRPRRHPQHRWQRRGRWSTTPCRRPRGLQPRRRISSPAAR